MKKLICLVSLLICIIGLIGCSMVVENIPTSLDVEQEVVSSEELAITAYSSFLSGDRTLLDETQSERWYIPSFQDILMKYEYTYLDLDEDGISELLVQLVDDPCGYNAVFHFEDGRIFCWNSDTVEMSCRDYPLKNGIMVRQYDYSGTRSYVLFRYQSNGEIENISQMFARDELIPEDSSEPCPYYTIDEKEVNQDEFNNQINSIIINQLIERIDWTEI